VAQGSATAFFALPSEPRTQRSKRPHQIGRNKWRTIASRLGRGKINYRDDEDMTFSRNGASESSDDSTTKPVSFSPRCPRRVVLLREGEDSEVERVLQEYHGTEVSGKRVHADVQRLADEHPGRCIAAEWLGSLGWTRFLWCCRP